MSKNKPAGVARTQAELQEAMREQMLLLVDHCRQYDGGSKHYAKPIAAALRLFLHETRNSHSLLKQLGLRNGNFYTVAAPLRIAPGAYECNLLAMEVGSDIKWLPELRQLGLRDRTPFPEWWAGPVIQAGGRTLSRQQIVLEIADTDGGAHLDPGLTAVYRAFVRGEFLGWRRFGGGVPADSAPYIGAGPHYACARTIAHEFLLTMQKYAPWSFSGPYVFSDGLSQG
jgi:hypothetical protein